jgi:aminopeptidase
LSLELNMSFPTFQLSRLLRTVFSPKIGEKLCILIDLDNPNEVIDFAFLKNDDLVVQRMAYEVFYQGLRKSAMQELQLSTCDFFAFETTGGSNLELPNIAVAPDGNAFSLDLDIYPAYDIILCVTVHSATAPLTASAKRFGFRGATMHGLNDIILQTGLAVDYSEVSRETEKLRKGMTNADSMEILFEVDGLFYHLFVELGRQNAQKSHGLCPAAPDVVNLPAGEVYFVPVDVVGAFPIKFDDGTLGLMQVDHGRAHTVTLLRGNQHIIDQCQAKLNADPATGILGELGFGTQQLPFAQSDIQDEKIFGTFHLALGRNDHLDGFVTANHFINPRNATHEDILFSSIKTPEIQVRCVQMERLGKKEILIENYQPAAYLWDLLKSQEVLADAL